MIIPGALMGVTDYVFVAGVAANPDSITAVLYRWVGATRSASGITVTPVAVGSGEYRFTWTVDSGFARTDELELVALPVVSGVTYPATVWRSHGGVDAVMRGTDSALTTLGTNAPADWINAAAIATGAFTAAKFASGAFDAVWAVATRTLSGFGTLVADIWANATRTITGTVTLATSQPNYAPAKAGDAMTLTSGERTAVANEVEAQIIDDTDSEKVLEAITTKIAAVNPDLGGLTLSAIAAAVRTNFAVELARINVAMNTLATQASVDIIDDLLDTEMAATKAAAEAAAADALITKTQTTAAAIRADMGLAAADVDDQLDDILAAAGGGGGGGTLAGPWTVDVVVTAGVVLLEGAFVRMQLAGDTETRETDEDGAAQYTLGTFTYNWRAWARGHAGQTGTLVVTADDTLEIDLVPLSVTAPSEPDTVTGYAIVLDALGAPEEDVVVTCRLVRGPSGSGTFYDTVARTATSDVNGLIQFQGIIPGGVYHIYRGSRVVLTEHTVPTDAVDTWEMPNINGTD